MDSPLLPKQSPAQISIEDLEASIQDLQNYRQWHQRWHQVLHFCGCAPVNEPEDDEANNKAPWRVQLAEILESSTVHFITVLLLLLDLAISVLDLSSSLASCSTKEEKENSELYHWAGITILCLLAVRIVALVVALGGSFFRRPGHIVDALVIAIALVAESVGEVKGAELVVVVSLWRLLKLVETAFELSKESIEAKIEKIESEFEDIKREHKKLEEAVAEKDDRIRQLQEQLNQY